MLARTSSLLIASLALLLVAHGVEAQDLRVQTTSFQHVTVKLGASAPDAAPGGSVSLWVDVTPNQGVHVYGPTAKDVEPAKLTIAPNPGMTAGKAVFPAAPLLALPGVKERVAAYSRTFRVTQPVALSGSVKRGAGVIVAGTLNYQACDDRVCFPPASLPLFWRIAVK